MAVNSVSYKMLRIDSNTITNCAFGVKVQNVRGYNITNQRYNDKYRDSSRTDISDIDHNTINVYASFTPSGPILSDYNAGIQLTGCYRLRAAVNTINTNQYNQWRNMGIQAENARYTQMYGNVLTAGRGIAAVYDGYGSDIKCNYFLKGVNGLSMQDYNVRSKNTLHGVPSKESRDNAFITTKAENIELYLYRTNPWVSANVRKMVNDNQWLMDKNSYSVFISPNPNSAFGTTKPMIDYIRAGSAPDLCGLGSDDDPGNGDLMGYDSSDFSTDDQLGTWQLKYEMERQAKSQGFVLNTFINKLIDVEDYVVNGSDSLAASVLSSMTPTHIYEANYVKIYTLIAQAHLQNDRKFDSIEVDTLIAIAQQHTAQAGPAIYIARTLLWQQENLNFADMQTREPGIGAQLVFDPCLNELPQPFIVQLKNSDGYTYSTNEVPVTVEADGDVYIRPDVVASLPTTVNYTFVFNQGEYPSPDYQTREEWMDNVDNTIYLCGYGKNGGTSQPTTIVTPQTTATAKPQQKVLTANAAIYPSPASQYIHVTMPDATDTYTVRMMDITGKVVYTHAAAVGLDIVVDQMVKGIYLVSITDKNGYIRLSKRIVVNP